MSAFKSSAEPWLHGKGAANRRVPVPVPVPVSIGGVQDITSGRPCIAASSQALVASITMRAPRAGSFAHQIYTKDRAKLSSISLHR